MIHQGLDLSLKQELKLNAQLVQTMEMLSFSQDELREKIKKEAESNPALLIHDGEASYDKLRNEYRSRTERRESFSDDAPYLPDDRENSNWMEAIVSEKESLQSHLMAELGCLNIEDNVRQTAETLITSLDRNGFFPSSPESLVRKDEQPYVKDALDIIRHMEPDGVGAMDWRDSLIIQAEAKGMEGNELRLFSSFVYNELDNARLGKFDIIAKNLGIEKEEVNALYEFLKTLTPFPGRRYGSEWEEYIIPELSIKKEDGILTMRVNKDAIPSVEIDPEYKELAEEYRKSDSREAQEAASFIKGKINAANNLITQLNMRARTIEKTGAVLMEKQRDFFLNGPLYLKGMTMQEVADEVGVHEATISRIASSKYIDTDFGIYPIRSLFSNSVTSDNGSNISKNAVKEMIRQIIEENSTGKALSDQKISDILMQRGIKTARRTVSKYRKELDIDSSFSRNS